MSKRTHEIQYKVNATLSAQAGQFSQVLKSAQTQLTALGNTKLPNVPKGMQELLGYLKGLEDVNKLAQRFRDTKLELPRLRQEIQTQQQRTNIAAGLYKAEAREVKTLERAIDAAKNKVQELSAELKNAVKSGAVEIKVSGGEKVTPILQELAAARSNLQALRDRQKLTNDLRKWQAQEQSRLREAYNAEKARLSASNKAALPDAKATYESKKNEINALYQSELARLKLPANKTEDAELKTQIAKAKQEIASIQKQFKAASKEALASAKSEVKQLESQLNTVQESFKKFEQGFKNKKAKVIDLKDTYQKSLEEIDALQKKLNSAGFFSTPARQLNQQLRQAEETLSRMKGRETEPAYQSTLRTIQRLREELSKLPQDSTAPKWTEQFRQGQKQLQAEIAKTTEAIQREQSALDAVSRYNQIRANAQPQLQALQNERLQAFAQAERYRQLAAKPFTDGYAKAREEVAAKQVQQLAALFATLGAKTAQGEKAYAQAMKDAKDLETNAMAQIQKNRELKTSAAIQQLERESQIYNKIVAMAAAKFGSAAKVQEFLARNLETMTKALPNRTAATDSNAVKNAGLKLAMILGEVCAKINSSAKNIEAAQKDTEKRLARANEAMLKSAAQRQTQAQETAMKSAVQKIAAIFAVVGSQIKSSGEKIAQAEEESAAKIAAAAEAAAAKIRAIEDRLSNAQSNFNDAYSTFQNAQNIAGNIMSPFTGSVREAADFERQMSVVKSLTQLDNIRAQNYAKINVEMGELTELAKKEGLRTQFTATDAARAETYLAYAGWNPKQIEDAVPTMLDLATAAGMTDLGRVADITSDIMMAFKIPAAQAQKVADVLTYTFTHSNQTLEMMADAMKYAAPVARLFGSSIEEAAAMTKFMADAGVKGSMAGTAMRQTMLRLVAPPKTSEKVLNENGLTLDDANKAWLTAVEIADAYGISLKEDATAGQQMASIIRQINSKLGDKTAHEKMAIFKAITGIYAVSGATNLFETGGEMVKDEKTGAMMTKLEQFTRDLEESAGSTKQIADVMRDNYWGSLVALESAISGLKIELGEALTPTLKVAAELATGFVRAFGEFSQNHPHIVQGLAAIAAGLSAVIVGSAGLSLAFAAFEYGAAQIAVFRTALAGAEIASAGFAARLGMLVRSAKGLAIFSTIAPFLTFGGWGKIGAGIAGAATGLRALGFAGVASMLGGKIVGAAKAAGSAILSLAKGFGVALRAGLSFVASPIGAALIALGAAAYALYNRWSIISPMLESLSNTLQARFAPALDAAKSALEFAGTAIDNLVSHLTGFSAGDSIAIGFVMALKVVGEVIAAMVQFVANGVAAMASLFGGLADVMNNVFEGHYEEAKIAARLMVENTGENLKNMFVQPLETIRNIPTETAKVPAYFEKLKQAEELRKQGYDVSVDPQTGAVVTKPKQMYLPNQSAMERRLSSYDEATQTYRLAHFVHDRDPVTGEELENYHTEYETISKDEYIARAAKISQQEHIANRRRAIVEQRAAQVQAQKAADNVPENVKKRELQEITIRAEVQREAANAQKESENIRAVFNANNPNNFANQNLQLNQGYNPAGVQNQSLNQGDMSFLNWLGDKFFGTAAAATPNAALDTSQVQAQLDSLGASANANSSALDGGANSSQNLSAALNTNSNAATSATNAINSLGTSAANSQGGIDSMTNAANNSTGGINQLASSSSTASGSVSGLGSAAESAISSLLNAAADVGSAISGAVSSAVSSVGNFFSGGIAQNAAGGIYNHGAFLTWFAERSPEAAIPLDGSDRAINLWKTAGQILGVYPAENYAGGIYARGGGSISARPNAAKAQDVVKELAAIFRRTESALTDNSRATENLTDAQAEVLQAVNDADLLKYETPYSDTFPSDNSMNKQFRLAVQSSNNLEKLPAEVKNSQTYQSLFYQNVNDRSSILVPDKSNHIYNEPEPKRKNFLEKLADEFDNFFERVGDSFKKLQKTIGDFPVSTPPFVPDDDYKRPSLGNFGNILSSVGNIFGGKFGNIANKIGGFIGTLSNGGGFGNIISGIGNIFGGKFGNIANSIGGIFNGLKNGGGIGSVISGIGGMFKGRTGGIISGLGNIASGIWGGGGIGSIISGAGSIFGGKVGNVFSSIGNVFGGLSGIDITRPVGGGFGGAFGNGISGVGGMFSGDGIFNSGDALVTALDGGFNGGNLREGDTNKSANFNITVNISGSNGQEIWQSFESQFENYMSEFNRRSFF